MEYYRFSFSTSLLAGCRACRLLRLHLLVLSYMSPCELHARSYSRTISGLFLQSHIHFCFFISQ
nr:MAG TPA: hypothetical protein [Caudoviricetes sp.]